MIVFTECSGFLHRGLFCAEKILFVSFYNPAIFCDFICCNAGKESVCSSQFLHKAGVVTWYYPLDKIKINRSLLAEGPRGSGFRGVPEKKKRRCQMFLKLSVQLVKVILMSIIFSYFTYSVQNIIYIVPLEKRENGCSGNNRCITGLWLCCGRFFLSASYTS